MVKVYKTGKNKKQIVLEVNEHKIALSNPSVQPHNEYIYNSPKDIMHFYYDIAIFEDTNHYNATRSEEEKQELIEEGENVNNVWKKKTETYVYEFGILPSIPEFIDSVLKFDIKNDGQRTYFLERDFKTREYVRSTTDFECIHTMELSGMCEEDNLIITKYCRYFDSSYNEKIDDYAPKYIEYYKVFIGCGNNQIKENVTGIFFTIWEKEDLLKIKEWANLFMDYTKEVAQKHIEKMYASKEDNCYYPYFFEQHLKERYPEDVSKLREIYPKLYYESSIIEEYYDFCKENEIEEPIELHRNGQVYTAKYFMDQGLKDYEAYIELAKLYRMY